MSDEQPSAPEAGGAAPGPDGPRRGNVLAAWWEELVEFWFRPVHPARLDTFMRVFTATFIYYMADRSTHAYEWLTDYGFHYTAETERLSHPVPLPTMPAYLVPVFLTVMFASAAAMVVGFRARIAVWFALACAIYVQGVDQISSFTLNKYYILCFSIFALAPPPRPFVCRDGVTRTLQSAWPIRVIQATVIIQYFTAGFCKVVHGDWLHSTDVLWTQVQGIYRTELAAWMLRELPRWAWSVMMYSALTFELSAPVLFMVRRLRPLGMAWGFGFHMMIAATMKKLILFSGQMVTFYLVFMSDKTILRIRRWVGLRDDAYAW